MDHADIVMISYNSRKFLPGFFHFIKSKSQFPFHLIVFDNASTDGSQAYLSRLKKVDSISPRMRLILNEKNLGVSKVWNKGINLCDGKYIVFLNPDVKLTGHWLERMVGCAERHPKAAIVGAKILNYNGVIHHAGQIGTVRGRGLPNKPGLFDKEEVVHGIQGSCFLLRRSIIPIVGQFDERFFVYGEEDDYCIRVRKAGYQVMYAPVPIYHYREGSDIPSQERLALRAKSGKQFRQKWNGQRSP